MMNQRNSFQPHLIDEALLRSVVDQLHFPVYTKNLSGRYTYANQRFCELIKTPLEALLGEDDSHFIDRTFSSNDQRVLRHGESVWTVGVIILKSSGSPQACWISESPIRDVDGEIIGLFGVCNLINKHKRLAKELKDQRRKLDTVLNNLDACLYLKDRDPRFINIDNVMVDFLGHSANHILQHRPAGIDDTPPESKPSNMPFELPEHPNDFSGYSSQISELARLQRKYADLIQSIEGIVWDADLPTLDFTFINQKAETLLGFSIDQWIKPGFWFEHLHPEDELWVRDYCSSSADRRESYDFECRFIAQDRRTVWLHVIASVIEDNERPRWLRGIMIDITEKKEIEHRDRRNSKMHQMLNDKMPLASILETLVLDLEILHPEMLCSILLLDESGKRLQHGAAPSLPDFYNKAIHELPIGPEIGACGSAAYSGKRVIIADIAAHPWCASFTDLAREAQLGSCWSQPIVSGQGKVLGTFAIYHQHPAQPTSQHLKLIEDEAAITALAIEKSYADSRVQLAASVFNHAHEGIVITDLNGKIIDVNDAFTQITGYTREDSIGQTPRILKSGRQSPEFYESLWQSLNEKGDWRGEIWNQRKNGTIYPELLRISTVFDAQQRPQNYVALLTDITVIKEHQKLLEKAAHYDSLTKLPNRLLLSDRLNQAITQSQRRKQLVVVGYLDLDGFKAVNDDFGHDFGDDLLVAITQRMSATLREGDTLARVGGDEFVFVLVDLEHEEICEFVMERLLKAANEPLIVRDKTMNISASIGVTIYPHKTADSDLLLRHADQAMYRAKKSGKNRYVMFDS
ncbi:MAG: diguanylate cyclase [Betaproteobacteria bacterium]